MKTPYSHSAVLRCIFCTLLSTVLAALVLLTPAALAAGDEDPTGDVNYLKARRLVLDGKFEEAAPLLEKAVKVDPENAYLNAQLSEVYLRLNNFEKAETHGEKAVKGEPNNVEYRKSLGAIYATLKKYPEAKEQYTKISELDPTNQTAPLLLGILEAESGDFAKGIEVLSKTLSENPDNVMALFYRAKVYLEMDQIEKAKTDLDRCLTLRPAFVEAGTALGLIYEKTNQPDEAIKTYGRIRGTGTFTKRLAQLYIQKNDYKNALAALIEYEKTQPDDYTSRVKIGLIYSELKDYSKAEAQLLRILKEQPDADNVNFHLGRIYEDQKQFEKAQKSYRKVSKDAGLFFVEASLRVGFIFRQKNQIQEGLAFSKKVLDANPDTVEFYDMHASFYEVKKDFKTALSVIERGLKKNASDEKLLYFRGALLDKTGDRPGAIETMKKLIVSNPENAHALNFLAYSWAESAENLDEAEKHARKAKDLKPGDGYIEDTLGWVLFKKGKIDDALAVLEKARELQPDETVILDHLGDVYAFKQDYAKATEYYKKAQTAAKKDKETLKKIESKLAVLGKEKRVPSNEAPAKKN